MAVNGKKQIKSVGQRNRVADLRGGDMTNPIIGYHPHGGDNQVFNFEPVEGNKVRISVKTNDGPTAFLSSVDAAPGSNVVAGPASSGWTATSLDDFWHISIVSSTGTELFWTLSSIDEDTKACAGQPSLPFRGLADLTQFGKCVQFTLQPANNSVNQIWTLNNA